MAALDVTACIRFFMNGTPPSAVSSNIASQIVIMNPDVKAKDVPSISYVRKCCTILRIIGETLASYKLAKAKDWQQLFADRISRRQTVIQNLIVTIKEDNVLKNIVLSSSIVPVGGLSEQ